MLNSNGHKIWAGHKNLKLIIINKRSGIAFILLINVKIPIMYNKMESPNLDIILTSCLF